MSKKLYVVFDNHFKEVAFITHNKSDIDLFFNRPTRQETYFYAKITDKSKINRFVDDFYDKNCEIEGSVCMTPSEYCYMEESIPGLVDNILKTIVELTKSIGYLTFTDNEIATVNEMLRLCYLQMRLETDEDNHDEPFIMELLMERFLNDIGA